MSDAYRWIGKSLQTIHRANWYRSVQSIDSYGGPTVTINGRSLINLASNDYLGLAADPRLVTQVKTAVERYGTGSTGSLLLSGHRPLHRELEQAIAQLKGTEDAIVFSSGYLANLGTITALVNSRDLILSDEYNHSSLRNGAALSGAKTITYAHGDLRDLSAKLAAARAAYRRCLILTDGVFGMDGDVCDLPQLLGLGDRFEAMVMIDEAHSVGVLGRTGAGCAEFFGCQDRPLVQMGTLSKALASLGGYVAGSAELVDFLRNRAASWIYTTGLSLADSAAALGAISLLIQEPERLSQLRQNVQYLIERIDHLLSSKATLLQTKSLNLRRLPSDSAIVCLQVKDATTVLSLAKHLREQGIFAAAVRPPTVPVSRLRLSLMATHTSAHIDQFIYTLSSYLKSV
ncbi:8-amino-7-oxononanoate synthase [Synechococcus sp. PCC 7335]|uniref:8-amino-7-oxononanoate synthase n=1 Tax=Synechococcus sp. (strain ATCC 29403 / PCC 7335) TaxID=91464 RepID=UPI00017EE3FC|nr:8-amino-7-oxononanoate synthase [Synechococcus sp. PCC 7335]EDX87512.1 8-amino-7-oxononanoate synthase [Synechococcus sp. PCC 7335]